MVLMIWLNWRLFVVVLVGALLIRIVESRLVATTSYRSEAVKKANSRLADRTLRIILSMRVVRAFGQERREADRFIGESDTLADASYRVWMSGNSLSPVLEVLHTGLLVIIVLVATMIDRSSSLPQIAAFLILLQRAQPHLRGLEQARIQFATASSSVVAVERLLAGLDREMPSIAERGQRPPPALERSIAFERVSFIYPAEGGERSALDAVSFTIPAHGATALVGPSGAGKSTIVNLLLRLFEPTSGRITIDGIPLAEIELAAWRSGVALAGQDIELIEGSIAQNIAYGRPEATMEEIVEAATIADAHAFIQKLPAGYETDVGARGLALSGGQRQRIGLARALVRRPALLILDEATSAVDALSESRILELLDQYRKERTLLIISHHQSTIARCDNVIRLAHGRTDAATAHALHTG
jgi:subfamily B ATP-binding cassette protein MsbA